MKVVGLLSGGKDSCYNLCHCVRNGHDLVALASLRPRAGTDELDSYLYQTVGQDGVHLIADALQLPLYRRTIAGTAVSVEAEYGSREATGEGLQGDETEDMYELLKEVKLAHPDVEAVSVGAILSNYQRVRVEHVCSRLGLVPLAYLWQRDQSDLLGEMVNAGVEAVLIKVAGIGLKPSHLGKSLREMRPTLESLNAKYGLHVCGEGGEYETFTLDCPIFKNRIRLDRVGTVYHPESSDLAPVAYLRIESASLVDKPSTSAVTLEDLVTVPDCLDREGVDAREAADRAPTCSPPNATPAPGAGNALPTNSVLCDGWAAFGSITAPGSLPVDAQLDRCFSILRDLLSSHGLTPSSLSHITLYLASMSDFPSVNAVYARQFGSSPPTRACVAIKLPEGVHVMMEAFARKEQGKGKRKALHVQGLSYWAPANIGPYSQAISNAERLFIAGQIGLVPSTLALLSPPSFATEAALSLQHVRRVIQAAASSPSESSLESVVCWLADMRDLDRARAAWRASPSLSGGDVEVVYAQAAGLPKGAKVEWQVVVRTPTQDEDEDEEEPARRPLSARVFHTPRASPTQAAEQARATGSAVTTVCVDAIAVGDSPPDRTVACSVLQTTC